ncbi:unnamed protein product [Chondrus crispus]|uniref:LrgB-like protein n=1 Tax=Chondrus crispus TaxID=2769 RepID=R7QCB2_CHOCR|nr:unnamed protein product [Chondrus crispus]CDF36142.1 unnamed protein product [Chondrus crispus]|eukprot:XP_005715961.1 unnamed protein product [Chondrus crispus]
MFNDPVLCLFPSPRRGALLARQGLHSSLLYRTAPIANLIRRITFLRSIMSTFMTKSCFINAAAIPTTACRLFSSTTSHQRPAFSTGISIRRHARSTIRTSPPLHRHIPHASATQATPPSQSATLVRTVISQVVSLSILVNIQAFVAARLAALGITFPAPLAAMLLIFFVLSLTRYLGHSQTVDWACMHYFTPGVAFLSRWLAVFFVPNLVMLPLAPQLPAADLAKIAFIIVAGFFTSLFSSAVTCSFLRFAVRKTTGRTPPKVISQTVTSTPPSNMLIGSLAAIIALTLAFSVRAASVTCLPAKIFALSATVLTFCIGQRLPRQLKAVFHPLITCTAGTIGLMALLGSATGLGFTTALSSYYIRTAGAWGGGNVLATLLGPAVITFAFTMDAQRKLALARVVEVVGTTLAATLTALFGTAVAARALKMTGASRLLVVPRTITAPLAVAIAELLGANVGLSASVVALTGLLGASIGATVLSAARVKDPVVRYWDPCPLPFWFRLLHKKSSWCE